MKNTKLFLGLESLKNKYFRRFFNKKGTENRSVLEYMRIRVPYFTTKRSKRRSFKRALFLVLISSASSACIYGKTFSKLSCNKTLSKFSDKNKSAETSQTPFSDDIGFSSQKIAISRPITSEDGTEHHVTKSTGKIHVIFFSTTSCKNCPAVAKTLSECARKINNKNIKFLNVIIGNENISEIKKHFNEINVKNMQICNPIPISYISGIDSIPTCIVFDGGGMQVFRFTGKVGYDKDVFVNFLKNLSYSCVAEAVDVGQNNKRNP